MKFSSLVERISGTGADVWLTHYAAVAARERGEDVLILSVGDPDLDTPQPVVQRAIDSLLAGDTHYVTASGRLALRTRIAQVHQARTGQPVTADNVVFLSGAQSALFVASLCLAGPGDEVLALEPYYPTYHATIEVSGARLLTIPTGAGWRPDLDRLASMITPRTRAILWASPNNPSGMVLNEGELEVIGNLAERHDLWLIADEVYASLAAGGRTPGLAARCPQRTVTLCSLSKSHAMTGWRAGWLVGPTPLAAYAEQLAMCMLFGQPGFVQEAALTALELGDEPQARARAYCTSRQQHFSRGLKGITGIQGIEPEAGMFMLLDVSATGLTGGEFVRQFFAAEGVSVMDGAAFGESSARCVRVCFATDERTLDEALKRLRRFCAGLPAARG
ncbi:MAG: pyridoxal phosphate-dependent aminotransferase [Proteobacteria bacterium]|nr:pyridoxal phosphate-dependent aminotransferase [Pseudomonadota bacterium]